MGSRDATDALAHLLLEAALPSAWFVTFVVAFILAPLSPALLVSFEHFWNAVLMSADVRASEHVVRRHHALLPCAWAALYVARSWARRAAGRGYNWTYEFLALRDGASVAWYAMLVVANVCVYGACARASERKLLPRRDPPERAPDAEAAAVETIALSDLGA